MDGLDQLWLSAPGPAVRLRPDAAPMWQLNPAAQRWSDRLGWSEGDWSGWAAQVATCAAGTPRGETALGPDATPVAWTAVALVPGWLVWLEPRSEVGSDAHEIAELKRLGRIGRWRRDLRTGVGHWDDEFFAMLGMARQPSPTVADFLQRVHPDDRAFVAAGAARLAQVAGRSEQRFRLMLGDGVVKQVYIVGDVQTGADGRPASVTGLLIDETETHARLREAEEKARAFADRIDRVTSAAGVGIWSVDPETGVVDWNEPMYRLYGQPHGATPHGPDTWLDHVHPDDRETARRHRVIEESGLQGIHAEFRIVRPDGTVRWVASWARREILNGRLLAFGVNLDVTDLHDTQDELQRTRERARLATESAGIGTWERDLRTGEARWDAQMYRMRGLPVGPETPGRDTRYGSYHPDDVEQIERNRARAGRDGSGYENEFRVVLPDGSVRWLATRGVVHRDANGEPERMLGVTWDVTERRQAEQALRDKVAAEKASQAKSQFLARMSHELRTPLNAVLGFAELMRNDIEDRLGGQQAQRVERIHSAGLHLLALIDDVLDLATIESDALPLANEAVSLQASLDDVLKWTQLQAAQAGITVHAQAMPELWVRGDGRRVRQVLSNLLSNAIKYNHRDGQVWISAQRSGRDGQPAWQLQVRDTGRGLSAEQCVHLFQPFNRLGAERGSIQGTGIGLAIVHHLVRLMGGDVTVSSEPGQGSEFRVTLLADSAPPPVEELPMSGFHGDADGEPVQGRLSVLYIEDNPVNVLLVKELVAMRTDVLLTVAVDGVSGVASAKATRPKVVLIDMQLPDIDGFEVLRRLRADPTLARSSMVALSANAMPEDVSRARAAGFDDYWTKPIDFHAFLRALARLAEHHAEGD